MAEMRFLETGKHCAAYNMGMDEAILEAVAAGYSPPTFRLYAWEPRAVSIGYFQNVDEEVNREYCAAQGIDVVRRLTGGGAVFHADEITYSFVMPHDDAFVRGELIDSYQAVCSGIIAGLAALGITAGFAGLNDICAGPEQKKISGNAQTRKNGVILQHGTILLSVDPAEMFSVLRVPDEKLRGKAIRSVRARVTSVEEMTGKTASYESSLEIFAKGCLDFFSSQGFIINRHGQDPSAQEHKRAEIIAAERFSSAAWTQKR